MKRSIRAGVAFRGSPSLEALKGDASCQHSKIDSCWTLVEMAVMLSVLSVAVAETVVQRFCNIK